MPHPRFRSSTPPKYTKPAGSYCTGCVCERFPTGFVPSLERPSAKILLVGEAPGYDEGIYGEPFVGAAGSMLTRILKIIGRTREEYRLANVYSCVLPGGTSERQSWAYSARESCR